MISECRENFMKCAVVKKSLKTTGVDFTFFEQVYHQYYITRLLNHAIIIRKNYLKRLRLL